MNLTQSFFLYSQNMLYWHIQNNINDMTNLFVKIIISFLQCRWIPVNIRDIKFPDSIKEEFQKIWVVLKESNKREKR